MYIQKIFVLSIFISFSIIAMEKDCSKISSLKNLCIKEIIKNGYNFDSLPTEIKNEISLQQETLNENLCLKCISHKSEPHEIKELLNKGADPYGNSTYGTLLEHVTEEGCMGCSCYNRIYTDGEGRARKIAQHLIQAGAKFSLLCLFNAVKTSNKEMFELLKNSYFPEYELKSFKCRNGLYRLQKVRNKDVWKDMTDNEGRNIFHHCAVYSRDINFVRWLFGMAKWKHIIAEDSSGDSALKLLRMQSDQDKKRLAARLINSMHNYRFYPVLLTEKIVDKTTDFFDWMRTVEEVYTILYNFKRLLNQ